jgi:pyrimidine operon attenuation protein/uracil phosphoribosyltransferase
MGYADDIKTLQDSIKRLQEIKEVLYAVEDVALDVEKGVSDIDARLPMREDLGKLADKEQRAQAEHALDLLDQAFALIDEILGPPEDELTGEPVGTPMDPVARGARPSEIRLEDFLRNYKPGGKGKVS